MNRIDRLFQSDKQNILSIYFTAGYPNLNDTVDIIKKLDELGVDLIEIGIPFSDPLADGPVIQQSSTKAIANGMNLPFLLNQLKDIRKVTDMPLVLMGYLNPVYSFGMDNFISACEQIGIDGIIIPDLPLREYEISFKARMDEAGLYNIFLVSPQTETERIRIIENISKGFIYLVSSASVTGAKEGIKDAQIAYFERIRELNLQVPTVIGFGISNAATFRTACTYASGAIIGSAFIAVLSKPGNLNDNISLFIKEILY